MAVAKALPPPKVLKEKISILENDKIAVHLSNIGGTVVKAMVKEFGETLPLDQIIGLEDFDGVSFIPETMAFNTIKYTALAEGLKIIKTYELSDNDYILKSTIEIINVSKMSKNIKINTFTLDISRLDKNIQKNRDRGLIEYSVGYDDEVLRKTGAVKFTEKERKSKDKNINFAGFRNRYFCAVIKPEFLTESFLINPISESKLSIIINPQDAKIKQNESREYSFISYFGPQKLKVLKEYDLGFEKIMVFFRWGFFDAIAKLIYLFLLFLFNIFKNWGICIIIVSLSIYFAMYPLTMKGMKSMKRMQSLQPQINKLREQHKNNPQKLNKEMMELYKEHKINPLGGCFPLFLQLPVFIGLYQVLWRSVYFKGAKFLWIKDLSEPDRLWKFPGTIPLLGDYLNILPILMVIIMVFQQKLSAKNMVVTDPAQIAQQKMMMTIFPLFLGFIFYNFASGLSLYFTIFYILSTFTQWKISKSTKVA